MLFFKENRLVIININSLFNLFKAHVSNYINLNYEVI